MQPDTPLPPFDFRRHGHAMVDWIADYLERVERLPVESQVEPGWVRSQLPPSPPAHGEPWDAVVHDIDRVIVPGLTNWQSPNFFAYFPANTCGPSILGELLSAGLGVQGMLWSTSPACTELETLMMDWLAEMLGLPARFRSPEGGGSQGGGVIQDTASSAMLCAAVAARERMLARDPRAGLLVAYASSQAHSSIEKSLRIAGIPASRLRLVPVDEHLAMRADDLRAMVERDRQAGLVPFLCVAAVGSTSTMAVDPVARIAPICREHAMWLHVDAAMAGVAAICPEHRWVTEGAELADSWCTNPHKWLAVNFDCDAFWVADRAALVRALSVLPEYLRNSATESGKVIDYRDWQVPLGRRFRALKLWFTIRHAGIEGLQRLVRTHVALAQSLADRMRADPRFMVIDPQRLGLVCFRLAAGCEATSALVHAVNRSGRAMMSSTRVPTTPDGKDRQVARVSIGQTRCTATHIDALWNLLRDTLRA